MKIWIITSGSESLTLFNFLSAYDHEYVVYYDFFHRPYGDKTFDQALACVQKGVDYLTKQGVEYIVVPPVYELALLDWKMKTLKDWKILPLFKNYLLDYGFNHSLVGKIGFFGDFADVGKIEPLVKKLAEWYTLNEHQKSIRKFHFPFAYRVKETPLWKYYLTSLSYSHILVNKIIKFDLRYFKDAMVDTVIPLNYWYFHYQGTISKFLNFKKIRFHTLEHIGKIFASLKLKESKKYSVHIAYTWNCEFLRREKRLMRLLQRGKKVEIEFEKL